MIHVQHADTLTVRVSDLLPGSHLQDVPQNYFPALNWDAYEETLRLIRDRPEVTSEHWPLRPLWERMCQQRFGRMPCECIPLDAGKLWTWSRFDAAFRRMVASFEKRGYDQSKTASGEEFEVAIEPNGQMPLIQGNKRVAWLRAFKGLDYEVSVRVARRADGWTALKKGLYDIPGKQDLHQPIPHPDFVGWPVA